MLILAKTISKIMSGKLYTLLFTLISFLIMAISGMVMFFFFQESSLNYVMGLKKNGWMNIHNIAAIITVLLVAYHVAMRWEWMENIVLRKKKVTLNRELIGRRRNNTWFLIAFSLSVSTGFFSWIMSGDCIYCLPIHDKAGLVLVLVFMMHIFKHRNTFLKRK